MGSELKAILRNTAGVSLPEDKMALTRSKGSLVGWTRRHQIAIYLRDAGDVERHWSTVLRMFEWVLSSATGTSFHVAVECAFQLQPDDSKSLMTGRQSYTWSPTVRSITSTDPDHTQNHLSCVEID